MILTKILTSIALLLGEVFIIGAEMWATKNFETLAKSWSIILTAFLISVVGVIFLVYGYIYGYQAFKNIWIVTALSVAGILIVEPIIAWFLFHEVPTVGASIGLLCGVLGLLATVFIK